jgi:hypothetical protein
LKGFHFKFYFSFFVFIQNKNGWDQFQYWCQVF